MEEEDFHLFLLGLKENLRKPWNVLKNLHQGFGMKLQIGNNNLIFIFVMENLTYTELLDIEGGSKKKPCGCRNAGREVARIVKENVIWESIGAAWDEIVSWFD
ncbi:Uncharacterised protein [Candidatus Ornithobacterium hominis]|uniref:Uncharacterized protein n=2 Tax=Candidatus Ornithobacterium hominis TaxID=2497989 RepID=A0A383U3T7_9FLAO|nr:Uncharacterised protein [Candidatus Ornithobacterium hominis]